MKMITKRKNILVPLFSGLILTFFAFSHIVLASEITKDSILGLVNQARSENGAEALVENQVLDQVAQNKLDDMIKNNYFAHTSPDGISPWSWFEKNGYDYKYAGENLALGFSSVENEHQAWMDSPTHKKNILNPNYKEIGIAVGRGTIDNELVTIAVQEFGAQAKNGVVGDVKTENNLSDEKSKELLDKNKEEKKGIVLNTGNNDSNDKFDNLLGDRKAEPKINLSQFKNALFEDKGVLKNSIWATSTAVMFICLMINLAALLFLAIHNLVGYLRKNQDIFKVVHGLLALIIIGSIIF